MEQLDKLIQLGKAAVLKTNIPSEYSEQDINEALRNELAKFADYKYYRANKNILFELIEEIANVAVPKKVSERFGTFAEVKTVNRGEKITFKQRTGKARGKRFVTVAGEFASYRTFNLDSRDITMNPKVYAGSAILEIEDFLTGRVDMPELVEIIIDGLSDAIYNEVQKALKASLNAPERPAANKTTQAGFTASEFDKVLNTVAAYGDTVNVYCTRAFASQMYNVPGWASSTTINPTSPSQDYNDVREMGYIGKYKGSDVIILEQSFEDENNTEKVVDEQYAYIIPAGKEKPVKIGLEGGVYLDEVKLEDGGQEVKAMNMFDVAVVSHNHWGIYRDTSL